MDIKFTLKQYTKMAVQNLYLPAVYQLYKKHPVQRDLVILADAHHDSRPESMELLAEELLRRGFALEEMYLDYQKASFRQVFGHMMRFMKRYASAGTVVICDNFLPAVSCRKKPETRLIQLWHACGALKKFGYDTTDDIPAGYRGNVFKGTDLVTVSAPFCVQPFTGAMRLPEGVVQAMGVSRTDRYFDEAWIADCRQRFEKFYGDMTGEPDQGGGAKQDGGTIPVADSAACGRKRRKIVLWAPTFRGNPGAPECVSLDIQKLQAQLGEDYLVLSSLHPHMQESKGAGLTTEEMFPCIDVLIADYSSLIFEYCLFDKSLVLYTPDFSEYTANRGFYMKYENIPGTQVFCEEALAEAVQSAASGGMDETKRTKFLRRYMSACDGHATERIVSYIQGE